MKMSFDASYCGFSTTTPPCPLRRVYDTPPRDVCYPSKVIDPCPPLRDARRCAVAKRKENFPHPSRSELPQQVRGANPSQRSTVLTTRNLNFYSRCPGAGSPHPLNEGTGPISPHAMLWNAHSILRLFCAPRRRYASLSRSTRTPGSCNALLNL